jgi:peptidoglycan/xylan/chitin deacetylase (PgdA/CDA1 family)
LLCRVEGVPDRFALTFDDGPSDGTTPRILDLLARRKACATSSCWMATSAAGPIWCAGWRRLARARHGSSLVFPLSLPGTIRGEIRRSHAAIVEAWASRRGITGRRSIHDAAASPLRARDGNLPVLGDVYPEDAHQPGVQRIVERVTRRLSGGSILILHDGSPLGEPDRGQTLAALELILDHAAHHRWNAVTVAELFAAGATATG